MKGDKIVAREFGVEWPWSQRLA